MLSYLQRKADLQLEARIDIKDYDESKLIEVRAPLQLPYQITWDQFERCYGTIEIDGKYYTYVKRKMVDGYIVYKCISNPAKEVIKSTEHILAKASQGTGHESERASSFVKALKYYIGDFDQDKHTPVLQGLSALKHIYWTLETAFVKSDFVTSSDKPPETNIFI